MFVYRPSVCRQDGLRERKRESTIQWLPNVLDPNAKAGQYTAWKDTAMHKQVYPNKVVLFTGYKHEISR